MTDFLAVENTSPLTLKPSLTARHQDATRYQPPQGLREAIDVALLLGEPLVLTGRPGAGKTQAAYWLAHLLNAGEVQRFDVKSTTAGADLLYTFDEVGRFRDAAAGRVKPLIDYLRFNALGAGIVRAIGPRAVLKTADGRPLVGDDALRRHEILLRKAFLGEQLQQPLDPAEREPLPSWMRDGVQLARLLPHDESFAVSEPTAVVVLIDELDKAPRDTPNDLLAEVERMEFLIPELGLVVARDNDAARPIVIITSNAEKGLPEPFLRRCAYFDVPFPLDSILADILAKCLNDMAPGRLVDDAVEISGLLTKDGANLDRTPGTAELMAFAEAARRIGGLSPSSSLRRWIADAPPELLGACLGVLLKSRADITRGAELLANWARGEGGGTARG